MPLVVIDPGHGGSDPGTVGNGLQEKDITLSAALKLRDALQRSGIKVIMTRTTDSLVLPGGTISQDLSARAEIANSNHADLFISWHVDSYPDPAVNGVATWIYPSTQETRTETVARSIVDSVSSATGQFNRGVKAADFAVLRETNMDAVLLESGFITNPQEAARLGTSDFQMLQAEAVAKAVCGFFGITYAAPPVTPTPGTDTEQWPDWAKDAITRTMQAGVIRGYEDGTFRPNNPVTRAELAVVVTRLYDLLRAGRTL